TVVPILAGLNIDERYARGSGANRHYFLTDALGSTRALTDGTGSIVQSYDYDPYGGTHPANATVQNPYRYTGREQDASGLYYYRARYYHPGVGRFVSEDPIGLAAGDLNIYAYVFGDPVSLTDPTGGFAWGVAFAAADLAIQLYQNGGSIACVNWGQVGLSMLGGGLLNGLLKGAFKFKAAGSHTWNTNPISSKFNNWLGRRHLAPLGAPSWVPEVAVGGAASILAPDGSGNCGCSC
ncbi:RHS repeat-associated core domain-containing protein, partial [Luteimonas huabeiensis]|uniref:RHS repeat-associated core domain-containing protein n=1 Tax=Luteimonas huabeiensis TaxID=1244513 RepID=UPI002AA2AEB6